MKRKARPDIFMVDSQDFAKFCEEVGFVELPLYRQHAAGLKTLYRPDNVPQHKDPFDRMLISQAKVEGIKFMTP